LIKRKTGIISAVIEPLLLLCFCVAFTRLAAAGPDADLETLLQEHARASPGCVFIVREEMQYLDPARVNELAPLLLETCISGRDIGEKRMQKKYGIDPNRDRPKKKSFSIPLVPLHEMNDERDILYRE